MKKRLKLNEIKVQSFVTGESRAVFGGASQQSCNNDELSCNPLCWAMTNQGPICPIIEGTIRC